MSKEWYSDQTDNSPFGLHYSDEFEVPMTRTQAEVASIMRIIRQTKEQPAVLDIAGGFGRIGAPLASDYGVNIVDVDLNGSFLRRAKKQGVCGVQGDMRNLPFANGSFNLALLMFTSFGYFDNDTDNQQVVEEACRVLRPMGIFLLDLPNYTGIRKNFKPDRTLMLPDNQRMQYRKRIAGNFLVETRTQVCSDGTKQSLEPLRLRMYEGNEITDVCRNGGFKTVILLDNNLQPFDPENSRRLWVKCTK